MRKTGQPARALALCDETLDFLAAHGVGLIPGYLLCALPFAVTGLFFLYAVSSRRGDALSPLCIALVVTGYLRWLGGAMVQRRVAAIRSGATPPAWGAMLRPYFWMRFLGQGMLAGPLAMDTLTSSRPWAGKNRLVKANRGFFFRYAAVFALFVFIAVLQLFVLHFFLTDVLVPHVLGLDFQMFGNVVFSRFWWMGMAMLFLLALEFYNLVAGVIVYQTLSSRWSGADLVSRFNLAYGDA